MSRVAGKFFLPDQALSSLSNALFAVIAVRAGVDAPMLATWFILNNVAVQIFRQTVLETTIIEGVVEETASFRPPRLHPFAALAAGGCIVSMCFVVVWHASPTLLLLPIASAAILAQDALRYLSFTIDRARSALVSDLVWVATAVIGVAVAAATGSAELGLVTWATGPIAGTAVCARMLGTRLPDATSRLQLVGRRSALIEVLVHQSQIPVLLGIIAATGLADDITALLVSRTALGPAVVVVVAVQSALLVRWARDAASATSLTRTATVLSLFVGLYVVGAAIGFTVVGEAVFSLSFGAIAPVMVPLGVAYAMDAATGVARIHLRAAGRSTTTAQLRVVAALLQIGGMLLGANIAGTSAAMIGLASGSTLSAIAYLATASRGLSRSAIHARS